MSFGLLEECAVGFIKEASGAFGFIMGAGSCACDNLSCAVFLILFSLTGAAAISAALLIGAALEDIHWSVRV